VAFLDWDLTISIYITDYIKLSKRQKVAQSIKTAGIGVFHQGKNAQGASLFLPGECI
jgi:hypothetical protein